MLHDAIRLSIGLGLNSKLVLMQRRRGAPPPPWRESERHSAGAGSANESSADGRSAAIKRRGIHRAPGEKLESPAFRIPA
jgi:hypothetical protein